MSQGNEVSAATIRPVVLGTAGHIDHGKTALVRALTGVDTDRLPEEKERGISIDLGFASFQPRPGLLISCVDVPGHERFVKNMLAGATGIDAVLFVVAANEGLMPQSREHFDIVRLLGLEQILVVLTKCDLADRETIDIVRLELEDYLGKSLGRVPPLFEVSSLTGQGLPALTEAVARLATQLPLPSREGAPRLSIDRKFVLQGHGTVVTGTQVSGRFQAGEAVEILPSGLQSRIRELQSHGQTTEETGPGLRVALKLHGVAVEEVTRGEVVSTPGTLVAGSILNAWIRLLPQSPLGLERRTRLRVHLGAAEVLARAVPLSAEALEPGQEGFVQLRLESPAVAVGGQRLVLRRYSPALTVGGGEVVEFPAPKSARGSEALLQILERLRRGRPEDVAAALAERAGVEGLPLADLKREFFRRGLPLSNLRFAGLTELPGERLLTLRRFEEQRAAVLEQLAAYHKQHPLEAGARPEKLRAGPLEVLSASAHAGLLQALERAKAVASDQDRWRLPTFRPILEEAAKDRLDALIAGLEKRGPVEEAGFLDELKPIGARPPALLQYLLAQNRLHRLEGGLLISPRTIARALAACQAQLNAPTGLGVAQLRDHTGWSRKFCIPFLEWTDSRSLTRRKGDTRLAGPALRAFLDSFGR